MSLITTMGQPSSPLFLTGEAVTGIDLTGLDYYYKKKEQADENLRKKLADQAPEIKEFDQKINALPGEKTYLYQKYVEKRNKISEGVKKYGGVWAVYVNTPEGRADLAALSENPYDATMADRNYMRWEGAVGDMTKEGTGKNIYLDQNFRPIVYKDKAGRVRYARNEDFLQTQAQEVEFDQNGRLAAKDYSITKGDSEDVTNEIRQFATAVGSSSSESSKPVLGTYFDPNTGTYSQGSSVMGGYDAYNYIMNTQVGSSSNTAQLNDAVGVISNSLSIEAQQGVWQEIYSGAEGKKLLLFMIRKVIQKNMLTIKSWIPMKIIVIRFIRGMFTKELNKELLLSGKVQVNQILEFRYLEKPKVLVSMTKNKKMKVISL